MKKLLFLTLTTLLSASLWATDVTYTEVFSKIGNLNNGTSDVYGDLCTWHRTLSSHRAQDTIAVKTRRAFLLPVAYAGAGKLETNDLEGGIKSVEFKFGRFGSENTEGRVLQLNIKAGTIENPTATYEKNAMKQSTQGKTTYETYSYDFNCKEQDAQFVIENISTHSETLNESSSICRILVADIVVTPYILYTQKEATIGVKQQGYVNQEFLDNSGGEALTYSSSNPSIATVDATTGVVTPVSAGDVQIYAALAEGARTHYTLHVVDGIVAENFSKVVQPSSASNATWHGDLFDWTANAARRGTNDTIKGRPIDRQQATWFSKEGYVESSAVVEGGVKNISFLWRQWSAKAASTTTKVAISYGGEIKAYQEFEELEANINKSFNEDIEGGDANAVLKISDLSYNGTGTVNNRIVIENIKITPWLLYTTKKVSIGLNQTGFVNNDLINNTGTNASYESSATSVADVDEYGVITPHAAGETTITASWGSVSTTYKLYVDASITEDYSKAPTSGVSTSRNTFDGNFSTWAYRNARSKESDKLNNGDRGFWLSPEASSANTYLETTTEGGIKKVDFDWRQFDKAQNGYLFVMSIKTNSSVELDRITFTGADSYVDTDQPYSKELAIRRTDSKLTIQNISTQSDGTTKGGKIIVGPITITPYLLYTDKYKKFMRIGSTYTNTSLINNTSSETGTLSYRSSNDEIATVDSSTGEVTGVAEGIVTITAKFAWDGSADYVETTYQVEVLPANCETFDGIAQTSNYANTTPRAGDKATWTTSLGGFNVGDCSVLTTNLVRFRAPYQESSDEAYIQSTAIEGGIASMTFDWNLGGDETPTNWDIRVIINGREVKRLNNEDITATNAMDHFEQITINDINEPDNFTIRFENHSAINGAYTSGNKARFIIDNIRWTSYSVTKTLDEDEDNSGWIRNNGGYTRTVAISRSPLQGGKWNTLCLPFAISKSTDLDGAEVQRMTSATLNPAGDELEIGFTEHTDDALTAGTPYLVKPSSNVDISKTYTNKQISMIASPVVQGIVTLQGIFSPTELVANDQSTLFVGNPDGEGNNLFYPGETGDLKGMRAYFKLSTPSGAPTLRRARFIVNEAQSPTALDEADNALQSSRKVLENGHLFIIRDGKKYNVTGQKIQ